MLIGVGIMSYAGIAMYLTDRFEEKMNIVPTEKDMEELRESIPKITIVERKKP